MPILSKGVVLDGWAVDPTAQFWSSPSPTTRFFLHRLMAEPNGRGTPPRRRMPTPLSSSSHVADMHSLVLMGRDVPVAAVAMVVFLSGFLTGLAVHRLRTSYVAARHIVALRRLRAPHLTLAPTGFYSGSHGSVVTMERIGYTLGYSYHHRCALWSAFVVSAEGVRHAAQVPRSLAFFTDVSVPKSCRWSAASMRVEGYDRGHLAPPASVGSCRESSDETSLVSNIALQHPRLNRQTWKGLEGAVRRYVLLAHVRGQQQSSSTGGEDRRRIGCQLAVTVGPVFLSKRSMQTSDNATPRIADAFFMALYDPSTGCTAAYVAKNNASGACERLSLKALEALLTESQQKQRDEEEALSSSSVSHRAHAATWRGRFKSLWSRTTMRSPQPAALLVTLFPQYRTVGGATLSPDGGGGGGAFRWVLRQLLSPLRSKGIPSAHPIQNPSEADLVLCKMNVHLGTNKAHHNRKKKATKTVATSK